VPGQLSEPGVDPKAELLEALPTPVPDRWEQ